MGLVVLGLVVLAVYLADPAHGVGRRVAVGEAVTGPTGRSPRGTTGGTRTGGSPTRRRSASRTTARTSGSAWRRRCRARRSGRGPGSWRGSAQGLPFRHGTGPGQPPRPAAAAQGDAARPGRRPGVRPRVRRPGQRRRDGPRVPDAGGPVVGRDDLQRLAPPSGMLVSINPERLLVQVDRNLAPERRGAAARPSTRRW